jgi:hypothetical protein
MTYTPPGTTTPRDAPRCPICLHAVTDPAAVKGCDHAFCLPCLRQWAASRPSPACPLCKVPITILRRADGTEEALPSPPPTTPTPDDAPPDLGCLDHSFFLEEARRLRRRVTSAQHSVAASRGRRPQDAAAAEELGHLGDALDILILDLQDEIPFDPEVTLKELYDLETALGAIGEGSGVGGGGAAAPRRLSAADALVGSDEYGYAYSDSEEEEDEEEKMARQMDRLGLGRRRSSARGSRGSLAHAASSSSLGSTVSQRK